MCTHSLAPGPALLLGLSVVSSLGTARAQFAIDVRTVTPMTARAGPNQQSIPANTLLRNRQGVQAAHQITPSCQSSATASVAFTSDASTAMAQFGCGVACEAVGCTNSGTGQAGSHTVRISIIAPTATPGYVVVSMNASGSGFVNSLQTLWSMDVDDDGSVELSGSANGFWQARLERAALVGPTPLTVVLTSMVSANALLGTVYASVNFTVAFHAAAGRMAASGPPCGARLTGDLIYDNGIRTLLFQADTTQSAPCRCSSSAPRTPPSRCHPRCACCAPTRSSRLR